MKKQTVVLLGLGLLAAAAALPPLSLPIADGRVLRLNPALAALPLLASALLFGRLLGAALFSDRLAVEAGSEDPAARTSEWRAILELEFLFTAWVAVPTVATGAALAVLYLMGAWPPLAAYTVGYHLACGLSTMLAAAFYYRTAGRSAAKDDA